MRYAPPERPVVKNEVGASGIDEALQTLTSDPYGSTAPSGVGLRIPALVPNNPGAPALNRYLFLLATRQVQRRCKIVGISQYLTIGTNAYSGEGSPQVRPLELAVTTPSFRFIDGNVSWHLVLEPNPSPRTRPLTDAPNFMQHKADGPALLYGAATIGADFIDGVTGAPEGGYAGNGCITAYTAPAVQSEWRAIAGLGCFYDIRYQQNASSIWNPNIEIAADSDMRVSFYASVLQTAGTSPSQTSIPTPVYLPPEEGFINSGWTNPVLYWRVSGRLVVEDDLTAGMDCDEAAPLGPKPRNGRYGA
jgi:hypothetical protein